MADLLNSRREALLALGAGALCGPALTTHAADGARETSGKSRALRNLLGHMPDRPKPVFDVIETIAIDGGRRLKIEYLAEPAYPLLHEPEDRIRAYLFVPDHSAGARLPAILALHQDGPHTHIGKRETAGLAGDANLHYGLELFRRGYVVLCPDRFYHAERRRGAAPDSVDAKRDEMLLGHRVGQLVLRGRTSFGKEAYDCMVAADLLSALPYVDASRIGAIGHSAGGIAMVFWMFLDPRVRAGISSCGLFDLVRFYDEKAPRRRSADAALPGLALVGDSSDYLAGIAPRPVLLTRGRWEWGTDGEWRQASLDHVAETERMMASAAARYRAAGAPGNLEAVYFEEAGGNHDFPPGIRQQAYIWLDRHLRHSPPQAGA